MRGSFKIGRYFGIDLFIHFTLPLFLAYFAWARYVEAGRSVDQALFMVAVIVTLFTCVVLHEYGHALMARKFGIPTHDITLFPIGGVARLDRMPEDPKQEIWVALAGPAVNVAIAGVLAAVLGFSKFFEARIDRLDSDFVMQLVKAHNFLETILIANVVLVVFNMLPAFPMDGGRVLRALLSMALPRAKATRLAATIGKVLAAGFVILGLTLPQYLLLFIAVFVWIGAEREAQDVELRSEMQPHACGDAMVTEFAALTPTVTLREAADKVLAGSQADFPVVDEGEIVGILTRKDLMTAAISGGDPEAMIGDFMLLDFPTCRAGEPLDECVARMRGANLPMLPVLEGRRLVGLLTVENLTEFMALRLLARDRKHSPVV